MPAPALAVARRSEQAIDQQLVGAWPRVSDELIHFLRRRWQSDQVEIRPANERSRVGLRQQRQPGRLKPGSNERIDRRPHASRRIKTGNGRSADRLKRPVVSFRLGDDKPVVDFFGFRPRRFRPGSDPPADQGHLFYREFLRAGWHFAFADALVEQAFVPLARLDIYGYQISRHCDFVESNAAHS